MNDPQGSKWRKWDLHFHTPISYDHGQKKISANEVVDRLVHANVEVVAVTDHHVIDIAFIQEMRRATRERLTILPGIEFACPLGGKGGVHFIGIFPEHADLAYLAPEIHSRSRLSEQRAEGRCDEDLYVDFSETAKAIRDLGGIVSIHAHGKANSIENIANNTALKQQFKTDILRDYVQLLEIGNKERTQDYRAIIFPDMGFSRPLVVASDDHCRGEYPADKCCWIKADPTFAGLKMALREPEYRFCLDDVPSDVDRVEKNKTKYIKSISFQKTPSMPAGEEWLQGQVPLNPGLVAVIGNKGSGKSAFSDCIGLLGSCATSGAFSFLENQRFRHPKTGRAEHIEATMSWQGGDPVTRMLSDEVTPDEPERVKYLPQNFVELVCNDLATPGGGAFEKELKKVVFSKVAQEDQLGKRTLDDLIEYRTAELRQKAEDLAQALLDLSQERARLEECLDPTVRVGLERKIEQKQEEIKIHEASQPEVKEPPPDDPSTDPDAAQSIRELAERKNDRDKIVISSEAQNQIIRDEQRRSSTAEKLLAKLDNLRSAVDRAINDMTAEAHTLGLKAEDLIVFAVKQDPVVSVRDDAIAKRNMARTTLGSSESDPPTGLSGALIHLDKQIKEIQVNLSRPQQAYQTYLDAKVKWNEALKKLTGSADNRESLVGLKNDLKALNVVPAQIKQVEEKQQVIAEAIHTIRVQEAEVFTELYAPVQTFINEHKLATEHLKLEFKVEVVEEGFIQKFLEFINQNKVGSFHGVEDGEKIARQVTSRVEWSNWGSVRAFLEAIAKHLNYDMRPGRKEAAVLLKTQMGKGRTASELYRWLYALGYLKPRYLLRWDGKDVEQLSPGERGTLLLIFYLLVDDSDVPLIIDQPEANLDNVTVAEKLTHCIRDARSRRQVIIVTHNPNLAVVCDADQVIHASLDKLAGNRITYESGGLECPKMNRFAIKVLEGGRNPFDIRDDTYRVTGE